jgi:hypothetical protein
LAVWIFANMKYRVAVIALLFALIGLTSHPLPPACAFDNCFITIVPPNGEAAFKVGPWTDNAKWSHCADWWGSFLWLHPDSCFYGGNCDVIGDGLAYPAKYPCVQGVPGCENPAQIIPAGAGVDTSYPPLNNGFYYLSYEPGAVGPVGGWMDSPDQLNSPGCNRALHKAQKEGKLVGSRCFCIGPTPGVCRGPNR